MAYSCTFCAWPQILPDSGNLIQDPNFAKDSWNFRYDGKSHWSIWLDCTAIQLPLLIAWNKAWWDKNPFYYLCENRIWPPLPADTLWPDLPDFRHFCKYFKVIVNFFPVFL